MSIALSVILRPSRLLYVLLSLILLLANVGWILGLSQIIQTPILLGLASVAGFTLSCIGFFRSIRQQKISQLDIDDEGRMIVRRLRLARSGSAFNRNISSGASEFDVVWSASAELGEDTVVWPNLFVLHLRLATTQIERIVILKDSVDHASFRRLGVALRWLMYDKKSSQMQENTNHQGNFTVKF
ncbi:MAG: hypothetical protein K2X63_02950 [Burkholderiaceae bacterium]|nr:hypothetical protein [Burkholderiaceae bacterium]